MSGVDWTGRSLAVVKDEETEMKRRQRWGGEGRGRRARSRRRRWKTEKKRKRKESKQKKKLSKKKSWVKKKRKNYTINDNSDSNVTILEPISSPPTQNLKCKHHIFLNKSIKKRPSDLNLHFVLHFLLVRRVWKLLGSALENNRVNI